MIAAGERINLQKCQADACQTIKRELDCGRVINKAFAGDKAAQTEAAKVGVTAFSSNPGAREAAQDQCVDFFETGSVMLQPYETYKAFYGPKVNQDTVDAANKAMKAGNAPEQPKDKNPPPKDDHGDDDGDAPQWLKEQCAKYSMIPHPNNRTCMKLPDDPTTDQNCFAQNKTYDELEGKCKPCEEGQKATVDNRCEEDPNAEVAFKRPPGGFYAKTAVGYSFGGYTHNKKIDPQVNSVEKMTMMIGVGVALNRYFRLEAMFKDVWFDQITVPGDSSNVIEPERHTGSVQVGAHATVPIISTKAVEWLVSAGLYAEALLYFTLTHPDGLAKIDEKKANDGSLMSDVFLGVGWQLRTAVAFAKRFEIGLGVQGPLDFLTQNPQYPQGEGNKEVGKTPTVMLDFTLFTW